MTYDATEPVTQGVTGSERSDGSGLADAHAPAPGGTFMYEFGWPSPIMDGRLGSCHALEMPFVFDTLDLGHGQMMGGDMKGMMQMMENCNEMMQAMTEHMKSNDGTGSEG